MKEVAIRVAARPVLACVIFRSSCDKLMRTFRWKVNTWMAFYLPCFIFTHLFLSTVKYNFMSVVKHNERFIRKKGLILKPTLFIPIAEKWISFSYQLQIIDYPINVNGVFTHHEFNVIKKSQQSSKTILQYYPLVFDSYEFKIAKISDSLTMNKLSLHIVGGGKLIN